MGSHKSKENGYMQMGARLYNAETGRFMSVDPLMEFFTGHSPYHYSYNNPVMFSDPSGLAPEGEKNNTIQAGGSDIISSGYTGGYWTTKVTFSYKNYFTKNLDDPLAPRGRTFHSDETITIENTFIPSSGAGGGGGVSIYMPESNGGFNGNRNSSRKTYNNTTSKSMRDQNAVNVNLNMNTTKVDKYNYKDVTQQFNYDLLKTKKFFENNRARINGFMNWKLILSPFDKLKEALDFFESMVGTRKKFDLKQKGKGYSPEELGAEFAFYDGELWNSDDFGNYNYGVAARAFGLPLWLAFAGAGINQTFHSWSPDLTNFVGFFDHKRDTYMILRGYYHED
jgi:RHS repeat-associated protein